MNESENKDFTDGIEKQLCDKYKSAIEVNVSPSTEKSILAAARSEFKNNTANREFLPRSWRNNLSIAAVLALCVALTGHFYDEYGNSFQSVKETAEITISSEQSLATDRIENIARSLPGASKSRENADENAEVNSTQFSNDLSEDSSVQMLENEIMYLRQEVQKLEREKRRLSQEGQSVEKEILNIQKNRKTFESIVSEPDTVNDGYYLDSEEDNEQLSIQLGEILNLWNAGDSDNAVNLTVEFLNNNKHLTIMDIKEYLPEELIEKIKFNNH